MSFPKANIIQPQTIIAVRVSNLFFFFVFSILENQKMKWSRMFLPSGRLADVGSMVRINKRNYIYICKISITHCQHFFFTIAL